MTQRTVCVGYVRVGTNLVYGSTTSVLTPVVPPEEGVKVITQIGVQDRQAGGVTKRPLHWRIDERVGGPKEEIR